jgi:hypothetical protein
MGFTASPRLIVALVVAGVAILAAVLTVGPTVVGSDADLEQHELSEEMMAVVRETSDRLLGLPSESLGDAVEKGLSPEARPEAAGAVVELLRTMREAQTCRLVAADGYGPTLIKAIYEITEENGHTRRVALMFQRRDGEVALLDVSL